MHSLPKRAMIGEDGGRQVIPRSSTSMIDRERLLQRFLRYVRIDTTAREGAATYPSSKGQLELGRLLARELEAIGLADARQTDHGIVLATIPSNVDHATPVVALNSHVDTSPETTGA